MNPNKWDKNEMPRAQESQLPNIPKISKAGIDLVLKRGLKKILKIRGNYNNCEVHLVSIAEYLPGYNC